MRCVSTGAILAAALLVTACVHSPASSMDPVSSMAPPSDMLARDGDVNEPPREGEPTARPTEPVIMVFPEDLPIDTDPIPDRLHYGIIVDDHLGSLQNERDTLAIQVKSLEEDNVRTRALMTEHADGHTHALEKLAACAEEHRKDLHDSQLQLLGLEQRLNDIEQSSKASDLETSNANANNEVLAMHLATATRRIAELERQLKEQSAPHVYLNATHPAPAMDPVAAHLTEVLTSHRQQGHVEIETRGAYTVVRLTGAYLFPSGSHEIGEDGMAMLHDIGAVLAQHPEYTVAVTGHTDNQIMRRVGQPSLRGNLELSSMRAQHAGNGLMAGGRVNLSTEGVGDTQPLVSNATEDGRAKNRRVEIHIAK